MMKEFKTFIMRGNVLDLAIGVVIGSAFTAIVTKVVDSLLTPLVSLIFLLLTGKKSADEALGSLVYTINGVSFKFGDVISAIITFLITAFVLFLVVKAANKWKSRHKNDEPSTPTSEDYLKQIRDLLAEQSKK